MSKGVSVALALLVVLAGGCGGSSGSTKTPTGAVELFRSHVDDEDWKGACNGLTQLGKAELPAVLQVSSTDEVDDFGELKSCPASLKKHAGRLRDELEGTEPRGTQKLKPNVARVTCKKGFWAVDTVEKPGVWRISSFPSRN
jgi:hypothetical protein